jgi:hypothetical protein
MELNVNEEVALSEVGVEKENRADLLPNKESKSLTPSAGKKVKLCECDCVCEAGRYWLPKKECSQRRPGGQADFLPLRAGELFWARSRGWEERRLPDGQKRPGKRLKWWMKKKTTSGYNIANPPNCFHFSGSKNKFKMGSPLFARSWSISGVPGGPISVKIEGEGLKYAPSPVRVSSCSGPWKVGNVAILMMFNNILWPATPPIQRSGRFRTLWTRNLVAIFLGQDRSRVFSLALRCFQLGKESCKYEQLVLSLLS